MTAQYKENTMKFDVDKIIPDLAGQPIAKPGSTEPGSADPLTMRDAIRAALIAPRTDGRPFTPQETLQRYDLAMGAMNAKGQVELSAEDIVLINTSMPNVWAPLIAGAVARHLHGAA